MGQKVKSRRHDVDGYAAGVADVCNDAGGVRWCGRCCAAQGAWHERCPRCGGALTSVRRALASIAPKTEAA